jgi:predicted nucleic acid-binding protein
VKPPIVYFDTSVFIGLLDNMQGRQPIAQNIIRYESEENAQIHTSIMTINEFINRTYDLNHDKSNCDDLVKSVVKSIRDIAVIDAFNDVVATEAARLLSVWGRLRNSKPDLPRDKKFRWDAIHLATANILKADRVYAWDNNWNDFPLDEVPGIKKIISPAEAPETLEQNALFSEETS